VNQIAHPAFGRTTAVGCTITNGGLSMSTTAAVGSGPGFQSHRAAIASSNGEQSA
jgi:hypothetical protein